MGAGCRLRWSGGEGESVTLEEGGRGQPQAGALPAFPCPAGLSRQCPSLKQPERGQPDPWTKGPRVVSWVILLFLQIMVQA